MTGIGFAGVAASLKASAESIDRIAKSSAKIGTSTENLIGLQHAADQMGASGNMMSDALEKMTRRTEKFEQTGGGPAAKSLQMLGLATDEFFQAKPAEQFIMLSEAVKDLDNATQRMAAFDILGKSGTNLVGVLGLGEEGIRKFMQEAKDLGKTFTPEEAAQVEKFNDTIDRLSKLFQGVSQRLMIAVAPQAEKWLEKFEETVQMFIRATRGPELESMTREQVQRVEERTGGGGFLRNLGNILGGAGGAGGGFLQAAGGELDKINQQTNRLLQEQLNEQKKSPTVNINLISGAGAGGATGGF